MVHRLPPKLETFPSQLEKQMDSKPRFLKPHLPPPPPPGLKSIQFHLDGRKGGFGKYHHVGGHRKHSSMNIGDPLRHLDRHRLHGWHHHKPVPPPPPPPPPFLGPKPRVGFHHALNSKKFVMDQFIRRQSPSRTPEQSPPPPAPPAMPDLRRRHRFGPKGRMRRQRIVSSPHPRSGPQPFRPPPTSTCHGRLAKPRFHGMRPRPRKRDQDAKITKTSKSPADIRRMYLASLRQAVVNETNELSYNTSININTNMGETKKQEPVTVDMDQKEEEELESVIYQETAVRWGEDAESFQITMDVAGFCPDNIRISLSNKNHNVPQLTIEGERQNRVGDSFFILEEFALYHDSDHENENRNDKDKLTTQANEPVESNECNGVRAFCQDGVLEISILKETIFNKDTTESTNVRKIPITTNDAKDVDENESTSSEKNSFVDKQEDNDEDYDIVVIASEVEATTEVFAPSDSLNSAADINESENDEDIVLVFHGDNDGERLQQVITAESEWKDEA